MRRNQRYTQKEMYSAIERCHVEGLSYSSYCKESGIHYATFKYWTKKYDKEKAGVVDKPKGATFLPVKVSSVVSASATIVITYPNGIRIDCPINTPTEQLTALVNHQ